MISAHAGRRRLPGALRLVMLVTLTAGLAMPVARARASVTAGALTFSDTQDIQVVAATQIDDRQYNVRVLSTALRRAVDVRILLPADYAQNSTARFPVLYLFHGTRSCRTASRHTGGRRTGSRWATPRRPPRHSS